MLNTKISLKSPFLLLSFFALTILTVFSACEKDDDDGPDNEEELITRVSLLFTDNTGATYTFEASDPEGDGLTPDEIDEVQLPANTDLTLAVSFWNDAASGGPENITIEVAEESLAHLICFEVSGAMAKPIITDKDEAGDPLGILSSFTTGTAGSGTLEVRLKHEPDKAATSPCTTGETDVEVTFDVSIQ